MSTQELERRHLARPVEFRASQSGLGTLYGYAAVYKRYSQNLGGFVEQVIPGAFAKTLGDNLQVMARYNHDDNMLLGTTGAKTLRLLDDATGLAYEIDPPDTSAGRDTSALVKRGDVAFSSFAFYTLEDDWAVTEQGFPLRSLINVQLIDVAPVNNPAYLDSTAGMRSLAARLDVEIDVASALTVEETRSLILGEPIDLPAAEARAEEQKEAEPEQGDTHSSAALRRILELQESLDKTK